MWVSGKIILESRGNKVHARYKSMPKRRREMYAHHLNYERISISHCTIRILYVYLRVKITATLIFFVTSTFRTILRTSGIVNQ